MSIRDSKKLTYNFMTSNRAAALATVGINGVPHVATVYCVVRDDLSVFFMTRVEGRKFQNLLHQPVVAMAFTGEGQLQAIQLTGQAQRIEDMELEHEIWYDLTRFSIQSADKRPLPAVQLFEFGATNELAIIKVTPIEMTYANFEPDDKGRNTSLFTQVI